MQLEITDSKAKQLDDVETSALKVLKDSLDTGDVSDASQLAMKSLNMVAKNRQTLTARGAIGFNMATAIGDEAAVTRYVSVTAPHVKKALAGKK